MTKKVYGLSYDLGDGSSKVEWHRSREKVDQLLYSDQGIHEYWGNQDGPMIELEFPDELDLEACGFHFCD